LKQPRAVLEKLFSSVKATLHKVQKRRLESSCSWSIL